MPRKNILNVLVENDGERVKELVHERKMWNDGLEATAKGKRRINRSLIAHNTAYEAQQKNKSDPFAGRRARSHMLNSRLTPQDVRAGCY